MHTSHTRVRARTMNWLVIAAHLLSKVNIQEEMAKPDKTATQPQLLAYLTRARVRAREDMNWLAIRAVERLQKRKRAEPQRPPLQDC